MPTRNEHMYNMFYSEIGRTWKTVPVVDVVEGARLKQVKQVGNFAHGVTEY